MIPTRDRVEGAFGSAEPCQVDRHPTTVAAWLLTCPGRGTAWTQWLLSCVTLADVPGLPPAKVTLPGATHEVLVMALQPKPVVGAALWTPADVGQLRYLTPGNIAQQFIADSNEHAADLTSLLAQAVVHGLLDPETADAPTRVRATWAQTIAATLDHERDVHHGRLN